MIIKTLITIEEEVGLIHVEDFVSCKYRRVAEVKL